jgi:hypothetical protein
MPKCANCGDFIYTEQQLRRLNETLGSAPVPCRCRRPAPEPSIQNRSIPAQRRRPRIEPTQNVTYVAPAPSIADQLAVLARLFREGSITKEEFEILKSRLISGGEL